MVKFKCFGHRGASGYEPENTLRSFRRALAMGCPWIELDVHAVDGELLVIHDDELDRTTNGHGKVSTSSLRYLRSLDAGMGERIPTLREVLDLTGDRCGVNIELKGPHTAGPVNRFLADFCRHRGRQEQFIISSFDHRELALTDPAWSRGVLFSKPAPFLETALSLDAHSIHLPLRFFGLGMDRIRQAKIRHAKIRHAKIRHAKIRHVLLQSVQDTIEAAHAANLVVYVYTVNDPGNIMHLLDISVDGVFSDYPDRVLELTHGH